MGRGEPGKDGSLDDTRGLVLEAQGGNQGALNALFTRYLPIAVRVAELRLGHRIRGREDAEDIAQESLLEALGSLPAFEPRSVGSFRNWMARIVENNVRDLERRRQSLKRGAGREQIRADLGDTSLSESVFPGTEPSPSQVAMGAELEERLEEALTEGLAGPYREVVILRNICEMGYAEIATEMGYEKQSTIRSLHTRAMQKLEQLLGSTARDLE